MKKRVAITGGFAFIPEFSRYAQPKSFYETQTQFINAVRAYDKNIQMLTQSHRRRPYFLLTFDINVITQSALHAK